MAFVTDAIRALVGTEGPRLTAPYPLGPDELRRFVQAGMEGDPVHWDEEAAAAGRYGGVVATPLYPMHVLRRASGTADPLERVHEDPGWDGTDLAAGLGGLPPIDIPELRRVLNGGTAAEFFQLARLGDTITAQSRYVSISEREARSGPMVLVEVQTSYTNQDGDLLLRSTMTVIMR